MQNPLFPCIDSHMQSGVPFNELPCSVRDQQRIGAVVRCFRVYEQNPFTKPREWLIHRERAYISPAYLNEAMELFEYIRTRYFGNSTQADQDLVKWAARKAIKVGADQGDVTAMLKGAAELRKANGDFKVNEENDIAKNTASLPWYLYRSPKAISEDAVEYTDHALIAEMERLGAAIDPHFLAIVDKRDRLAQSSQSGTESNRDSDYLTDDLYDEYD